jgi:putative DNA primase/helicase
MSNGAGKKGVRKDIDAATPVAPAGTPPGGGRPPSPPAYLQNRFIMKDDGLFKKTFDDDKPDVWVCGRIEIEAETVDDDERWGLYLAWRDRNGALRREVFARELFSGECGELRNLLAAGGLTFNGDRSARQAFVEYINVAASPNRARVVAQTGWHRINGKRVMVMHDEIFGASGERLILQTKSRELSPFNQAGTLAEWRDHISTLCIGNSRLTLAACIAFAAPLLDIVGEDGGGVHLVAAAKTGKTTAALIASSVCGGDGASGGARAFMRTWRSTSNGLEGVAAAHSDCGLVIDELGQAEPRDVGGAAYLLSSGVTKARADRNGGLRAPLRFRALFLSTGELGLSEKIAEGGTGTKTFAGQEVRMVDLPADPGAGLGILENLHERDSAAVFFQELRTATARFYGVPFRVFLRHLVKRIEIEADLPEKLREELETIIKSWLVPLGADGGQVRSVARRFGLIALAGRIATEALITGWAPGEAENAAHACLLAWIAKRGTLGAREDADAVLQLRAFISKHGASRFESWVEKVADDAAQTDIDTGPPTEKFRTVNRAGWRRYIPEDRAFQYLLTVDGMKEALAGLDYKPSLKVLVARTYLVPDKEGKSAQSLRVPGAGKQRLFVVRSGIISAEADGADDDGGAGGDPASLSQ